MDTTSSRIAERFHRALEAISKEALDKQAKTRHLPKVADELEKMVDSSMLREAVAKYLDNHPLPNAPIIVFMDRRGGGDGVKISSDLLEIISAKCSCAQYVHVSFVTPQGGVGTLLRSALVRKGAECGILVDVVAHKRPAEGMRISTDEADALVADCDLVITFAPEGTAGLIYPSDDAHDELIARSHLSVLSFPDAEHIVADLVRYEQIISQRPGFKHIRFWIQVKEAQGYTTIGQCTLGTGGDAHERLWTLVDNAKRQLYRVLAEPIARDVSVGIPLVYPCKRLLESSPFFGIIPDKIVQAGSDIIMVAHRGK